MDFKTFLKINSFADNQFIDDFYDIIKEDYFEKYNDFLIDSELLRKWLEINRKQEFNDTIKKSYKVNVDYTLIKQKKQMVLVDIIERS